MEYLQRSSVHNWLNRKLWLNGKHPSSAHPHPQPLAQVWLYSHAPSPASLKVSQTLVRHVRLPLFPRLHKQYKKRGKSGSRALFMPHACSKFWKLSNMTEDNISSKTARPQKGLEFLIKNSISLSCFFRFKVWYGTFFFSILTLRHPTRPRAQSGDEADKFSRCR